MLISGIQQCTLIDYPEKTACIVFTPGCNFRCGFCHNPEFVLPGRIAKIKDTFIPESSFFRFLDTRKGLLDGVVISGGEPTMMPDLIRFMHEIKSRGFLVKLDTNGNKPAVIQEALSEGVVDYLAMDFKTSLEYYRLLVGPLVRPDRVAQSIRLIMESGIAYEFRSTLIKEIHSEPILEDMADTIRGAAQFFLQTFGNGTTLDPKFQTFHPFSNEEMERIADTFRGAVTHVAVR